MKTCTKCGEAKPLSEFYRRGDGAGYRSACRTCVCAGNRRWADANPGRIAETRRSWREGNPERVREIQRASMRRRRERDPEAVREVNRAYCDRLRAAVFAHYGDKCQCCGGAEDLTIDHVNGDGYQHRAEVMGDPRKSGVWFYRWLVEASFPSGFQVLCRICNNSKRNGRQCRLVHEMAVA